MRGRQTAPRGRELEKDHCWGVVEKGEKVVRNGRPGDMMECGLPWTGQGSGRPTALTENCCNYTF